MNRLNSDLKRLLRLSRDPSPVAEAPHGFATRVIAQADLRGDSGGTELQVGLGVVNWIAALLILSGVMYWQAQRDAPITGQFAQAAQFVANNLSP